MPGRPKRWTLKTEDGVLTVTLTRWKYFPDLVSDSLRDLPEYIYRGQASSDWPLEPTLDRTLRLRGSLADSRVRADHLERFRRAIRGRRGTNPTPITSENELWALGQHYGLATPLLDWTLSPYVAAYFAYADAHPVGTRYRALWALQHHSALKKSAEIEQTYRGAGRAPVIEIVDPMLDDNARLVSQGGIFTRAPDGMDIERWVRGNFVHEQGGILIKVLLPNTDRSDALRQLNRMNINHLSLFPELYGSARFCNYSLEVDRY